MPRPLYPQTPERQAAALRRELDALKKRTASHWIYVGGDQPDAPAFLDGNTNTGGTLVPWRFRVLQGGGVEIQGSGGIAGTRIFRLPAFLVPSHELRLAASDDAGNFAVLRVLGANATSGTPGDVIAGV